MKIAVDIGGTFTDVLGVDETGRFTTAKLPTQADDLSHSFLAGVDAAVAAAQTPPATPTELLYSTTLGLNLLLAHRLPRIGLVVNEGFRELLETARLPPPEDATQDTHQSLPPRLVPLEFVSEVSARAEADGSVRVPVDAAAVSALAQSYRDRDIRVVAVSLLHSYADAAQEREIAAIFSRTAPDIEVVLSSEVLPELREYERTLATCLNACLIAPMHAHLGDLLDESAKVPLFIMKSSGGLSSARSIRRKPLATALSGPSAAVVGLSWLGPQIGSDNLITLDVGGTSTDVALVNAGKYAMTTTGEVAGFPFKSPMIDVFTIGAGGGSVAQQGVDERWRVGPESAGADPGPACYGRGGAATLTDAQLLLGRLPNALLGGTLPLDFEAARTALTAFGAARGLDAVSTARGILDIATHDMCGAIRRVSVLRGHDPGDYTLLATGGAGPLHGAELARLLGMEKVVVPPQPGLASAYGLFVADLEDDFVCACGMQEDNVDAVRLGAAFDELEQAAARFLAEEGIETARRRLRRFIDMRYAGMLYETSIELASEAITPETIAASLDRFHDSFERLSGYSHRGREAVELINLRVGAIGERDKPALVQPADGPAGAAVPRTRRPVSFLQHPGFVDTPVYDRDSLGAGADLPGPAVIEQYESTIIVPPDFAAAVDGFGNVVLQSANAEMRL